MLGCVLRQGNTSRHTIYTKPGKSGAILINCTAYVRHLNSKHKKSLGVGDNSQSELTHDEVDSEFNLNDGNQIADQADHVDADNGQYE